MTNMIDSEDVQKKEAVALPPVTVRPTKKQRQILEYISEFIAQNGYSPSYREIMNALNYTSVATVSLHVTNLIRRGHIAKRDHSARSLEVIVPIVNDTSKIKTNEIDESEEKWLLEKIDYIFSQIEAEAIATSETVSNMQVLIQALHLLGIEAGALQFRQRLDKLAKTKDAMKLKN